MIRLGGVINIQRQWLLLVETISYIYYKVKHLGKKGVKGDDTLQSSKYESGVRRKINLKDFDLKKNGSLYRSLILNFNEGNLDLYK